MDRAAVKTLPWKCDIHVALPSSVVTKEERPKYPGHRDPNSPASPTGTPSNATTTLRNKHIPGPIVVGETMQNRTLQSFSKAGQKRKTRGRMADRHTLHLCLPVILPSHTQASFPATPVDFPPMRPPQGHLSLEYVLKRSMFLTKYLLMTAPGMSSRNWLTPQCYTCLADISGC